MEKDIKVLYDWLRIARKPSNSLKQDLKLLFELISVPLSQSQLQVLQNIIDPKRQKTCLELEDIVSCFIVEQQCKKPKQKQLMKAFRYLSNSNQTVSIQQLKKYFQQQNIDNQTTQNVIKQLCEYIKDGKFDFKLFSSSVY